MLPKQQLTVEIPSTTHFGEFDFMVSPAIAPLAASISPRIERAWAMPQSDVTCIPAINQLLVEEFGDRTVTDPFYPNAVFYAPEQLRGLYDNSQEAVLFRPPTTFRQAERYIKEHGMKWDGRSSWWSDMKDEVARITQLGGVVISVGWDSNGLGIGREFQMERILLVAHGGHWRDTVVTVERQTRDSQWFPDIRTLNTLEDDLAEFGKPVVVVAQQ
jgi:hypothetical protein